MRQAHASHALDRGAMVTTVRDTLGHSSIAVTATSTMAGAPSRLTRAVRRTRD
jgi:site-specific recombinase XerD